MVDSSEQIEATLSKIIFQNDSGFIIGLFIDKNNNRTTALGSMVNPQLKMDYILTGHYEENHKFGEQFKFTDYESLVPVDTQGIFKYIVRICKFVGATVGNKIIDTYGDKTLIIMKTSPKKLSREISGITLDRAIEIQSTLLENEKTEKIMIELGKMLDIPGMRKNLQTELIKQYKSNAVEILKQNPYILTQFNGIGFPLADRVAINIGFAPDSIKRKEAVIIYCLRQNMQEGSIWINDKNLFLKINELVQIPRIEDGLKTLSDNKLIVCDCDYYALSDPAMDESYISKKIIEMLDI